MHVLFTNIQRGCESPNRGCEVHVNSVGDMTFPLVYSDCQMRVRALLLRVGVCVGV